MMDTANPGFVYFIGSFSGLTAKLIGIVHERYSIMHCESVNEFLESEPTDVGCIVLDLRRSTRGLHIQQSLRAVGVVFPIIGICDVNDLQVAIEAMKKGAATVLEASASSQAFINAVADTLQEDAAIRQGRRCKTELARRFRALTEIEKRMVPFLLNGTPNKVIASRLDVGLRTVEYHRALILRKMGAKSIAELVRLVMVMSGESTFSAGHVPDQVLIPPVIPLLN